MTDLQSIFSFSEIDSGFFLELIVRLIINILFLYITIDRIYYRYNHKNKYLLSYYLVSLLIFFISSLLASATVKTGFAFGLFAVFSIIRYRTDQLRIKDMTYLFMSVIIAVINSLVTSQVSIYIILFSNLFIIFSLLILERLWFSIPRETIVVDVEDITLVHQNQYEKLLGVLIERTGLAISGVKIQSIDYLKDTFTVKAFYNEYSSEK